MIVAAMPLDVRKGSAFPTPAQLKIPGGYASECLRGIASLKNSDAAVRQSLTAHQAA
jgi:hypothetical protein